MSNYRITFTRYGDCNREISAPIFRQAENFREAMSKAEDYMQGMREVDPSREYEIEAIVCEGYSGTRYKGYLSIWEDCPVEEAAA